MASNVAHAQRGVGGKCLFDLQRVGDEGGDGQVGLHAARNKQSTCWRRSAALYGIAPHKNVREAGGADIVGWVVRRILIRAIAQRVLQIVVHTETGADDRLLSERAPRE